MLPQHKSRSGETCYLTCLLRKIIMNLKIKNKKPDLNVYLENTKRIKYDYKVNDLILLDRGT
jgi:hypothetical protein